MTINEQQNYSMIIAEKDCLSSLVFIWSNVQNV
jgi:hypothetical protein